MKAGVVSLIAWALVLPELALAQGRIEPNTISQIQVRGGTVEITGTKKPNFTTFTMTDPPRLVIDISEAVFSGVKDEIAVGNGIISGIRTASYGSEESAIARVLIGYERDVETDIQASSNSLVVSVVSGGAPAVAQGTPPAVAETSDTSAAQAAAAREKQEREEAQALAAREKQEREEAQALAAREKQEREKQEREEAQALAAREKQEREAAQAEARRQAEARAEAERKAKQEEAARLMTERQRREEEARVAAEEKTRLAAEEKARREEEARAAAEAKRLAREEARAQAAAEKARREEEARAQAAAEKARREEEARTAQAAAEKARREEARAAAEAKRQAREDALAQAAAQKARREQEARAAAEAKRQARLSARTESRPAPQDERSSGSPGRKMVTLVGFQPESGTGRVFVRTDEPVAYSIAPTGDRMVVLELENTRIGRSNNTHALDTSFFDTPVAAVDPRPGSSRSVKVFIRLKEQVPFQARQEGNEISIEFQPPTARR